MQRKKRAGLRKKATVIFLVVSLTPLIFITFFTAAIMNEGYANIARSDAINGAELLRRTEESATAIVAASINHTTLDYSHKIGGRLEHYLKMVDQQADYIEYMLERNITCTNISSYTQYEEPEDVFFSPAYGKNISFTSSVYLLAPHRLPGDNESGNLTEEEVYQDIMTTAMMDPLWKSMYSNGEEDVLWFYISTESGVHRSYPWHSGYAEDYDARTRDWYLNATGDVGFSDIYYGASGGGLQISVRKNIYLHGEKYGVVAADISVEGLCNISSCVDNENPLIDRTFIITPDGSVVGHENLVPYMESIMEEENLTWRDDLPPVNIKELELDTPEFNMILENMAMNGSGQEMCAYPDGEKYLSFETVNSTGWIVVTVTDTSVVDSLKEPALAYIASMNKEMGEVIDQNRGGVINLGIITFILIAVLTASVSIMFSESLVYPVISLARDVEETAEDITHPIGIRGSDEIAQLCMAFEDMRQRIKTDIDELEEKNRTLKRINEHLTRLISENQLMTEKTAHLYQKALRNERVKEEMLETLAHELRTPITVLGGNIELLEASMGDVLNDKQKRRLKIMKEANARLTKIINDSLFLLNLEKRDLVLNLEKINVEEMIDEAIDRVKEVKEKGQKVRKKIEVREMRGNRELLTRALEEVIENAAQNSPPGSEINITVKEENGGIHIIVTDEGAGIPEDERKSVFEKFYSLKKNESHRDKRIGLGLALVKSAVERHDGNVWISGERGTSLHIWIVQKESKEGGG